ncbi:MAG: response regulator, partial [Actinomycetia bacterium]|nr:response regulator [Actinomycetes bacterium]
MPGSVAGDPETVPHLVLDHRDDIFAFEFAALHFATPEKNRYAYRLQGFRPDWVETDAERRFAQYTNLDPGDYVFQVKASNRDGVWNQEGASIRITVLPPPWRTWWAYSLYTLALAAVVLAYIRSHRKELQRERQIAERERAASQRLRETDKLKDEFLANTSHELRTPLYGITGLAESLIDGAAGEASEAMKANLAMIVAGGRRLGHLVNDILDFSKLRHKSIELDRRPVELHALVDVVLTLSASLAGGKDLRLENAVAPDLPAADADENRLQQILYNLVGNAVKFTEKGSVKVSATVSGERLAVRVSDTGIGIPEEQQERIFDAFEQADASVEREYGGTGLGLAVSRRLVELHGGTLGLESVPGEGSTFSFSLEVAAAEAPAGGPAKASRPAVERHPIIEVAEPSVTVPAASAGAAAGGPRVLVVDDEPVNLQVVRNYLAVEHFDLTLASSGDQALRLRAEETFDLGLLDVMMPRISGYEVCRSLRASHSLSDLPVIFLTAKTQDSDVV